MALSNDMSRLLNKVENRLGLKLLVSHLPEDLGKDAWANVVMTDSIVTFSRYYPNQFKMLINDNTVDKKLENGVTWYYIKDEILQGAKLLGLKDIDWMDNTTNNSSLTNGNVGQYYYPSMACPTQTFEDIVALQFNADFSSLYNRGLYIDFQYPNRFSIKGLSNTNYDLNSFTVILLVEHSSLNTISPTKMEAFEALAQADIANFLYMNLRYYDNLETAYINIDLKLSELQDAAQRRQDAIEALKEGWVSPSNDATPIIWGI